MLISEVDTSKYTILKNTYIEEIQSHLIEIEYKPLGCQLVFLRNVDQENSFCLSFRTLPKNSNGVAHILEHTVLCGSEKFPVRDPFFLMTRRSLNTYMNALTGSDFTCYPAASQVEQDFYNLLDVYCDAVFYPRLDIESFWQEGHRLEFKNASDSTTPLQIKGIVFNEMKGSLNSGETRLWHKMMELLYPGSLYQYNSGGIPDEIPQLTYEELKEFHREHYHPSRCIFYFYGNLPLENHLKFLEEKVFSRHEYQAQLPLMSDQPRLRAPVYHTMSYPALEGTKEEEGYVALGWITTKLSQIQDVLVLHVLDTILMGHDGALLKKSLLEKSIAHQCFSSFDEEMHEIPYALIFRGCDPSQAQEIEKKVLGLLEEIAQQSIDPFLVEGALHQLELHRLEITGNRFPYGLSLFFRSVLGLQHGGDVESQLRIHSVFEELKKKCLTPGYLGDMIRKYFIETPHRVCLSMLPDGHLAKKEECSELQQLEKIQESLSQEKINELIVQAQRLKEHQENEDLEDPDILPRLNLGDVSLDPKQFDLKEYTLPFCKVYHHDSFTNGILYAQCYWPLPHLSLKELPWVRLLTSLLTELGCAGQSYQESLDRMQAYTGGVAASQLLLNSAFDLDDIYGFLSLKGKSLFSYREELFSLMQDYAFMPNFLESSRIAQLLQQQISDLEVSLQQSPMSYASSLARSRLSLRHRVSSYWSGLDYYYFLKSLVEKGLSGPNLETIITSLRLIHSKLFHFNEMELVITCTEEERATLLAESFWDGQKLKPKPWIGFHPEVRLEKLSSQGRIVNSQVAYTALAFKTHNYADPEAPYLSLVSEILENNTLHTKIREQGGAYGSGSDHDPSSGYFSFYAYRDPHLSSTIDAIYESISDVANGDFDDEDIEEAKFGLIQGMDSPIAPGSRGRVAWTWMKERKTFELRKEQRIRLLKATKQDLIAATNKWLVRSVKKAPIISFSSREFFEKETKKMDISFDILPI